MGVQLCEQETTISFSREDGQAVIYTSDTTVMTKLDKLVKSEAAPQWQLKQEHHSQSGELVAKTYVTSKRLISFRADFPAVHMTEEQKEASRTRLRRYMEEKRALERGENKDA